METTGNTNENEDEIGQQEKAEAAIQAQNGVANHAVDVVPGSQLNIQRFF